MSVRASSHYNVRPGNVGRIPNEAGSSLIVRTGNILERPADAIVSPANSFGYMAFRAALIALVEHNRTGNSIRTLLVPGMGTGIGQVPPGRAARQMRHAYDTVIGRGSREAPDARQILRTHRDLMV